MEIEVRGKAGAESAFEDGMELWWAGEKKKAARRFRDALKLDPGHADAHNHLGIVDLEAGRLDAAARHFEAAIRGGERELLRDGALIES